MLKKIPSLIWILSAVFICAHSFAETEVLNPGPRSKKEAQILLKQGNEALQDKDYKSAIRDLKRFIERYPSDEGVNDAYLALMNALYVEAKFQEVLTYGKELLNRNPDRLLNNHAKTMIAETHLLKKDYFTARVTADEILKAEPTDKQKATVYSIKFQSFLEEKQYSEAEAQLDALVTHLQTVPIATFSKLIPEFKMTLAMRKCSISHLLNNKQFTPSSDEDEDPQFTETELTEYFSHKNICFKSALPETLNVSNKEVLHEWCESFTNINHEIEKLRIDPFLKQKISKELKSTFEFSKTLSPDLSKCYVPYKNPKVKKRHRKRRLHPSRTSSSMVQ